MNEAPDLNERERQILQAVVHHYITTAEPVGSRTVARRFGVGLSPASIRNTMADLEELGYLRQLHTSSGRVPTETGYRYYVNHLMRVQELTQADRTRIESEFEAKMEDADAVLRQTSHLLALVTHQAGIAEAPLQGQATVQRFELMPLSRERLVVLIADNFGRVHSMSTQLAAPLEENELTSVTRFLNETLKDVTLDNLASAVHGRLRSFLDEQRKLAEQALKVLELMPSHRPARLYLEGATHLFEQPEFSDIEKAREVFGLFDEQDRLVELLRSAASKADAGYGAIVIGGEDSEKGLERISLVAAPYQVDGRPLGMVGVLGPRRMPYPRLTAIVDYTAGMVGRLLGRLGN